MSEKPTWSQEYDRHVVPRTARATGYFAAGEEVTEVLSRLFNRIDLLQQQLQIQGEQLHALMDRMRGQCAECGEETFNDYLCVKCRNRG